MLRHTYILDKPKSKEPTFVFFKCLCNDGYLKYSLKVKVLPGEWNGSRTIKKSLLNIAIDRINQKMQEVNLKLMVGGTAVEKKDLEKELDVLLGRVKVEEVKAVENKFFAQFEQIINERISGTELFKGKKFSTETTRAYAVTKRVLQGWQTKTGYLLDWQTFDMDAYRAFYAYLTNTEKLALNTVGQRLKTLKAFLKAAYKRGWHTNNVFTNPDFHVPSEDTTDIYLSVEELERIAALVLEGDMLKARDWFLVEAFTALRVSDVKRLKLVNISDNRITIANEKTDKVVIIPIHRILRKVLEDNGNKWPAPLSEKRINQHLKEIAKKAGIGGTVLYSVTKAGVRVDEHIPRWKMVSNHTGRRSFVTNNIKLGTPGHLTKKMAGIKSEKTYARYNKMSAEESAEQAAELPFFK